MPLADRGGRGGGGGAQAGGAAGEEGAADAGQAGAFLRARALAVWFASDNGDTFSHVLNLEISRESIPILVIGFRKQSLLTLTAYLARCAQVLKVTIIKGTPVCQVRSVTLGSSADWWARRKIARLQYAVHGTLYTSMGRGVVSDSRRLS